MKSGEPNLQLMLRYRLARYNPQHGNSWGVSSDWFTSKKNTKDSQVQNFGAISVKLGKSWAKGCIKFHHAREWKYLTQTFGGWRDWNS